MTTLTAAALTESQQTLIDARLDTIDRMLLSRIPRPDRIIIVHEVESQIQELLAEQNAEAISREDVLDVLRRLDPPEAYLPEETDAGPYSSKPGFAGLPRTPAGKAKPVAASYGRIGGILGICTFGLIFLYPVLYVLVAVLESEIFALFAFAALGFFGLAGSVAGLVLSIRGRSEGVLPILGMIGALIAMPIHGLGLAFTAYIMMNM